MAKKGANDGMTSLSDTIPKKSKNESGGTFSSQKPQNKAQSNTNNKESNTNQEKDSPNKKSGQEHQPKRFNSKANPRNSHTSKQFQRKEGGKPASFLKTFQGQNRIFEKTRLYIWRLD